MKSINNWGLWIITATRALFRERQVAAGKSFFTSAVMSEWWDIMRWKWKNLLCVWFESHPIHLYTVRVDVSFLWLPTFFFFMCNWLWRVWIMSSFLSVSPALMGGSLNGPTITPIKDPPSSLWVVFLSILRYNSSLSQYQWWKVKCFFCCFSHVKAGRGWVTMNSSGVSPGKLPGPVHLELRGNFCLLRTDVVHMLKLYPVDEFPEKHSCTWYF